MSQPLSPAAQVVAWSQCPMPEGFKCIPQPCRQCQKQGAAAIRAAADQVVPENAEAVGDKHDDARADQWMRIRYKFLAIAAELDGTNPTNQED